MASDDSMKCAEGGMNQSAPVPVPSAPGHARTGSVGSREDGPPSARQSGDQDAASAHGSHSGSVHSEPQSVGSNASNSRRKFWTWKDVFGPKKTSDSGSATKSDTATKSEGAADDVAVESAPAAPSASQTTGAAVPAQAVVPAGNLELDGAGPKGPEPWDEAVSPAVAAALKAAASPPTGGASGAGPPGEVDALDEADDLDAGDEGIDGSDEGMDGIDDATPNPVEPRVEAPRGMPSLPKRPPAASSRSARPAGMGGGLPLRPAAARPSGLGPGLPGRPGTGALSPPTVGSRGVEVVPEEPPAVRAVREKLLQIRLTMLRAVSRLGMRPGDILVQEFMNRVDTAERVRYSRAPVRPSIEHLFQQALDLEQEQGANSDLGHSATVLVLGPTAVGKTSMIQNILAEGPELAPEFATNPTKGITTMTGQVCGLKMTFIDTPGLRMAASKRRQSMVYLRKVKAAVNRYKPQIVIYVDRMDIFRREFSDLPLLRLINDMLPNMLYSCIAILTHANAPPPDGTHGEMPYNEYYRMRLDAASQIISHGIQDMRWGGRPLGFENHPGCRTNEGVPMLPNGMPFKRNTIGQIITSRLFREVESIVQINRSGRPPPIQQMINFIGPRKQLQLSALVAQLLQSKAPKKFPEEERDLKSESELQLMDERTRMMEEQKRRDYVRLRRVEVLQEEAHPSQVPIVGQKMDLNPSFDHDVNSHRYNATDFVGGWSVRPIISQQDATYDHDEGIEMFQVAREGVVRPKGQHIGGFPSSMIIQ
ncbi:unnamed protein product, partial [Ostreobium quekettii]